MILRGIATCHAEVRACRQAGVSEPRSIIKGIRNAPQDDMFVYVLYNTPHMTDIPRRATLGRMVEQSTLLLLIAIGSLILVLALLILFHQNANATKGYQLRTLERERSQLLLAEEVLKMELAEAQALGHLQQDKQIRVMIPPKTSQYVEMQ